MSFTKISMIGAGVMGEALIAALIKAGHAPEHIEIFEKRPERAQELCESYGIKQGSDLSWSQVLLLVVKPQDLEALLDQIKSRISSDTLIISFVAGKKMNKISAALGGVNPIVRVMPNTPALV